MFLKLFVQQHLLGNSIHNVIYITSKSPTLNIRMEKTQNVLDAFLKQSNKC